MATRTSVGTGDWSVAGTWDTGVPVNGDTAVIANTHTVTFDVDQSGFANGITLTINAGGTLTVKDDAGAYYLKSNAADITVNGTWTIGTSIAVPFTGTFTVDFNGAAKSIEVSATGHLYWYCKQPTSPYITITEDLTGGAESAADVDTDVTADIWAAGDTVAVVDSTPTDVEYMTINAGGIAAGVITFTANVTADKSANSLLVLVTRNIRVINVAASDYAITYANTTTAGDGDYIGAEFNQCYRCVSQGYGFNFAGTSQPLANANAGCLNTSSSITISGWITGHNTATSFTGTTNCTDFEVTGLIAGAKLRGINTGYNGILSGRVFGCAYGIYGGGGNSYTITSTGVIDYCTYGIQECPVVICFGEVVNCTNTAITRGGRLYIGNATISGTTYDLRAVNSGASYNSIFSGAGSEFGEYNISQRLESDYFESFDHDGTVNAFKAWCRGGIVSSATASPPSGYTIYYNHVPESASYPCFRQYATTVLPGTAIEVTGQIRINGAGDHTAYPPALQIVDAFADPLVDSMQSYLDSDAVAEPDGSVEAGWQDVSVIWANQGDAPRQVIVRMFTQHAAGDVDEVWAIATYQDQIQTLYNTLVPNMGETTANGNAGGTTVIDTTRTEANDYWNGMSLQVSNGSYAGQIRTIKDWDLATGTFTITPAFSGQIVSGVDYRIVTAALFQPGIQIVPIFPPIVEPDTSSNVVLGITLITNNGLPVSADLTAGTITIYRIRSSGYTIIVNAAACSKSTGSIYYNYTFPSASWQAGDIYYVLLNGQEVIVNGITYPISYNAIYGSVTREAEILEDTGTTIPALLATAQADLDTITGADGATISTASITAVWAKAMSDLAAGAPSATASVLTAINYLYEYWRNKVTTNKTNQEITVYKDDGTTALCESDISDDGTTFTKGEFRTAT